MTNHHGNNSLVTSQQAYSFSRNWPSPTFSKETSNKPPLHESLELTHVFGRTNPKCVTPNQSFEESSDKAIHVCVSSATSAWDSLTERTRQISFKSIIGLPSEYPSSHSKRSNSTNSTCSSILSEEEVDDFDGIFDDSSYQKVFDTSFHNVHQTKNPLKADACSQQKPTYLRSRTTRRIHRRQRTEIVSTESYREMMVASDQRRRRKNHALCAKDCDEMLLEHLFPANNPLHSFVTETSPHWLAT
jgi:hypothetical protein